MRKNLWQVSACLFCAYEGVFLTFPFSLAFNCDNANKTWRTKWNSEVMASLSCWKHCYTTSWKKKRNQKIFISLSTSLWLLTEHSVAKITPFTQILKQRLQKLSVKLSRNTCLEKMTLTFIKTFIRCKSRKDIKFKNANFPYSSFYLRLFLTMQLATVQFDFDIFVSTLYEILKNYHISWGITDENII